MRGVSSPPYPEPRRRPRRRGAPAGHRRWQARQGSAASGPAHRSPRDRTPVALAHPRWPGRQRICVLPPPAGSPARADTTPRRRHDGRWCCA